MKPLLKNSYDHSEMETLDHLIINSLNFEDPDFRTFSQDLNHYGQTAKFLMKTIKNLIADNPLLLTTEEETRCIVHYYQRHLIYLCDCITRYSIKSQTLVKNKWLEGYIRLLEEVSNMLIDMLDSLESNSKKYFDYEIELPEVVKEKEKNAFSIKFAEISEYSDFWKDKLVQIVLLPVFKFQEYDDTETIVTFRKIFYLKVLLKEVIDTFKTEKNVIETLKWKLIYNNFNSLHFYFYMQNEIKDILLMESGNLEKNRKLNKYMKQIKQAGAGDNSNFGLNPQNTPINALLSEWIKEEINYIEKYPDIKYEKASLEEV